MKSKYFSSNRTWTDEVLKYHITIVRQTQDPLPQSGMCLFVCTYFIQNLISTNIANLVFNTDYFHKNFLTEIMILFYLFCFFLGGEGREGRRKFLLMFCHTIDELMKLTNNMKIMDQAAKKDLVVYGIRLHIHIYIISLLRLRKFTIDKSGSIKILVGFRKKLNIFPVLPFY